MENPDGVRYVGFWIRLLAMVIDTVLLLVVIMPLLIAVFWKELSQLDPTDPTLELPFSGPMYYLIVGILPAAAVLIFWRYRSATPGKMIFSAVIADAQTGGRPSLGQFVVRYLGYVISTIPFCMGFIWIAFDRRKQAWHDKLADTVVVRKS